MRPIWSWQILPQFRQMVSVYVHKESNAGDMKIKICCVPSECVSQREQRYGKGAMGRFRGAGPHSRVLISSMPLQSLRR